VAFAQFLLTLQKSILRLFEPLREFAFSVLANPPPQVANEMTNDGFVLRPHKAGTTILKNGGLPIRKILKFLFLYGNNIKFEYCIASVMQ
jgi:hypothetical protein